MSVTQQFSTRWRKSSYSGIGNGDCVELTSRSTRIAVRDSKSPDAGSLALDTSAWSSFVSRSTRRHNTLD